MKLFAPSYYKNFKCIADKCLHSCCIGWEIDIDGETLRRYDSLSDGYSEIIKKSISRDDTPHFLLAENDRCPHLNECGLCKIIINLGEDHLSEICKEHPRFYNTTSLGLEVGLGASCEEAARIILNADDYSIVEIGKAEKLSLPDYNAHEESQKAYKILSKRDTPLDERIKTLEESLDLNIRNISDAEWQELLNSLEYLDEKHKELFACYSSLAELDKKFDAPLERALAYFIYRHCGKATDEYEFRASVGLSIFLTNLVRSVAKKLQIRDTDELSEVFRIVSEEIEYSEDNTENILFEF